MACVAASAPPRLLVTIDTEGDGLWWRPHAIETTNAAFLPRFQRLCETYGVLPTYLTNYEMAVSPVFREMARDVLAREAGEVGMHLHAWHSPPEYSLTGDDARHHPYLIEYPARIMRAKIAYLTDLLEQTFEVKVVSHRSGRWSFSAAYARLLVAHGYRVDCSVTPHVSWRWTLGAPGGNGGTDYSRFPDDAYFLDLDDISRPGPSMLLEVPMTIVPPRPPSVQRLAHRVLPSTRLVARVLNRVVAPQWLRPNGRNLRDLLRIVDDAVAHQRRYIQCMLHSSELMPGGSPAFRTADSIEVLYDHLECLFAHATRSFSAATLAQFRHDVAQDVTRRQPA